MTDSAIDYKNLAGMLGCTLPVYAIPFLGGVFGLGIGMAGIIVGKRKMRETLRHLGEQPTTPLGSLRLGAQARVRGTVVTGKTKRAPIGESEGVLVQAKVLRTTSNVGDDKEVWREVWSEPFDIRCAGGTARIEGSQAELLTQFSSREKWEGTPTDEVAKVMGKEATRLQTTYREKGFTRKHSFEYVESWIAVGDDVTVNGVVNNVQEEQIAGAAYRQTKLAMHVAIDAELVTNVSDARLHRRMRKHKTMYVGGAVSLALALANVVGFGLWFFG